MMVLFVVQSNARRTNTVDDKNIIRFRRGKRIKITEYEYTIITTEVPRNLSGIADDSEKEKYAYFHRNIKTILY